ncbi:MAG: molybdopterin-synthase adenylyltransferase MoeB [Planctomycetota bacterium]
MTAKAPTSVLRIPTPLRRFTDGRSEIPIAGATLRDAFDGLRVTHPELLERVLDAEGTPRPFVHVFADGRNVARAGGLATPLGEIAAFTILPAVAGGAPSGREKRLAELRDLIAEIEPDEALALQRSGATLLDVREPEEVAAGSPVGAIRMGRGFLELRVEDVAPDKDAPLVVMCQGGQRSLFAADGIARIGYRDVRSLRGGFAAWEARALPIEAPRTLSPGERERYARHLTMPEVGEAGQAKLLDSRVLLVGAGGLGSPAAFYLAAAGVGHLTIVDDDVVDRSNLQRQILHTDDRVGSPKVESAAETLRALNPGVTVEPIRARLDASNAEELVGRHDVVVDGTDNFGTRYLVNDACVAAGVPNVHGSIFRFEGQVSVFAPHLGGPCYRCIYPTPPPPELAPNCAEAGVLGVLPGVVGTLEAIETIKLLLGVGDPLVGRLLHFDALEARFDVYEVERDPNCVRCGSHEAAAAPIVEHAGPACAFDLAASEVTA